MFYISIYEILCLLAIGLIYPLIYFVITMTGKLKKQKPLGNYISKNKNHPHVD